MSGITALNRMEEAEAAARLRDCCGSSRWVRRMVSRRPYRSLEHLLMEAESAWASMEPIDLKEAFSHHPRIGERKPEARVSSVAAGWSAGEQRLAQGVDEARRKDLAEANAEYERRFGWIYIVCATGLTTDDVLADLRRRLGHAPRDELRVAAAEQARIMVLRLRKLVGEER